jgi:methylmalonyl-CoA mutase N-terminal domain/subunit
VDDPAVRGVRSAEETNARFRYLLEHGQTGLSVAFDLPTQLGLDSDDPRALGEVGRTGVAIDSLADMEVLLAGIPLDEVSTSMTINAPAMILLLLYELVAEKQGIASSSLQAPCERRIREYVARDRITRRAPVVVDDRPISYCAGRPLEHDLDLGYHIRGRLDGGTNSRSRLRTGSRIGRRHARRAFAGCVR